MIKQTEKRMLGISIVMFILICIMFYYCLTQEPIESYNRKHIEMINDQIITATIVDKEVIKTPIYTYLPRYAHQYRLYIDSAYLVDCNECGATIEYSEKYLNISKEMYYNYEIGDKINS